MTSVFGVPMTYVIFAGDMLVMAFMIVVAVWLLLRPNDAQIDATARIPLDDEAVGFGGRDAE